MRKKILLTVLSNILTICNMFGQSIFKPYSFNELIAPYVMATQAYNKAYEQFEEYYVKGTEELRKREPNYGLAFFYFKRCISLNANWDNEFENMGKLYVLAGYSTYNNGNYEEGKTYFEKAAYNYGSSVAREYLKQITNF